MDPGPSAICFPFRSGPRQQVQAEIGTRTPIRFSDDVCPGHRPPWRASSVSHRLRGNLNPGDARCEVAEAAETKVDPRQERYDSVANHQKAGSGMAPGNCAAIE